MTDSFRLVRILSHLAGVVLAAGIFAQAAAAQDTEVAVASRDDAYAARSAVRPAAAAAEGGFVPDPLSNCGDALSVALQQGTPDFPCWADIRTVDRWNSASFGSVNTPGQEDVGGLPRRAPSSFSFAPGAFNGFSLPGESEGKVYGGLGAVAGLLERPRWQLMGEDGGGLADLQYSGGHLVGLNRAALQVTGELAPRWTWQGSATNTYGTDAARQFAPLDYRVVGQSEVPAPDTVFYGLHPGRMTGGEEGFKLRYEDSRRSAWDFSASHDYTQYNADNFLVQTARARAEYLHSVAPGLSVGFYGSGGHQTSPLECDLGGGGLRLLSAWGTRNSLNVSGGVNGASASCGKRVEFTGNLAFYTRVTSATDFYVTANRDLSDGVLEQTALLSTGGAGIRRAFGRRLDLRAGVNAAYGTDAVTKATYHGAFVDGSLHYRLWQGFSQEMEIRHFAVAGLPVEQSRTAAVFTLWWTPKSNTESNTARTAQR